MRIFPLFFALSWKCLLLLVMLTAADSLMARPRTALEMKTAAAEVLAPRMKKGNRQQLPIQLLEQRNGLSVYGYEDSGFAVIAHDDAFPAILGYSETKYNPDTKNENFKWWLRSMEKVLATPGHGPAKIIKPDSEKHKPKVEPLLETFWNQDYPYDMLVPSGCPTGCVATAIAQVCYFNQWPINGQGQPYTYYPFGDFDGNCLTDDLEQTTYRYDQMLPEYGYNGGTNLQRTAVAKLMYHCGLAMKAQYATTGTGSYSEALCNGLRNHLRYPLAVSVNRSQYTDEEWMDIIFTQLSNGIPLVYGGADETYNGHEFVLHGYNSQGRIYINWGWGGDLDGYFDLSNLSVYWGFYDFSKYQDMVLRCTPTMLECDTVAVTVETAGTLLEQLTETEQDSVVALIVSGDVNSTDLRTLRRMAGCDEYGHGTMGHLSFLDLSAARIVAGGEPYLIDEGVEYVTADDEIPFMAFSNCPFLIDVVLPDNLKTYSDGVFANCNNLDTVRVAAGADSDFFVAGPYVLSRDTTQLIEALPTMVVHYQVPAGVKAIHPYAFAGRYLYERLSLPESVETIGAYAFNRCFDLSRTYCFGSEPPVIDVTAIDPLDLSLRHLYVPNGSRLVYRNTEGWKKYASRIWEFDAEAGISATTAHRECIGKGVYTIDGRKVADSPHYLPTGTYVVDGKKVLVR